MNPYCAVLVKEYVESGKSTGSMCGRKGEEMVARPDKYVGDDPFRDVWGN